MVCRLIIFLLVASALADSYARAVDSPQKTPAAATLSARRTDRFGKVLAASPPLRLGSNVLRQESFITGAAVSPDGKLVATTGSTATAPICLWDSASGRLVGSLGNADDGGNWWNSIAFSPDGRKLAAGSLPGSMGIRIWDVAMQRVALEHPVDGCSIGRMAYAPDGQRIAAFAQNPRPENPGEIVLLDASTGKKQRGFQLPTYEQTPGRPRDPHPRKLPPFQYPSHLSFSVDGRFLAATAFNRTFAVWDLQAAEKDALLLAVHDESRGSFSSLHLLPDGRHVLLSGYRTIDRTKFPLPVPEPESQVDAADITVWSLATGRQEREIPLPEPLAGNAWGQSALSADGSRIYWPSRKGVEVLDFKTGRVLQTLDKTDDYCFGTHSVHISHDETRVASVVENELVLWDSRTGRRLHAGLPGHKAEVTGVAFSANGNRIFTSGRDLTLQQWDAHTGRCLSTMRGGLALAASRDARLVASARVDSWDTHYHCVLAIVEAETGKVLREFPFLVSAPFEENWQLALSADAKQVALNMLSRGIRILDSLTGHELVSCPSDINAVVQSLSFSADGKQLLAANTNAWVDAWDISSGRLAKRFTAFELDKKKVENPHLFAAAFSPDASHLVAAHGSSVYSWSLKTREVVSAIDLPTDRPISKLVLSPDGRLTATLEPIRFAVENYPDGWRQHGVGGILRVWETTTGLLQESIEFPSREPASFAFSPDNSRLATGMHDGTTLVWDLAKDNASASIPSR